MVGNDFEFSPPDPVISISPAKAAKKKTTKKKAARKKRKKKARKKTTAAGSTRAKAHGPKPVFSADDLCEIQPIVTDDNGTKLTCRHKAKGGADNKEFYDPPQRWLYYLSVTTTGTGPNAVTKALWVPRRQLTGHDVIDFDRWLKAIYSDFLIEVQPVGPDLEQWMYKIPLLDPGLPSSASPFISREGAIEEAHRALTMYIAYPPMGDRLIQLADAETFAYHVVDVEPPQPDHDPLMTPSGIRVGATKLQPYQSR